MDEGFSSYLRQYWQLQELASDEAVIGWNDGTIKDLHNMTWTPSNEFIRMMYDRIFEPSTTHEIRLYGLDGADVFDVDENAKSIILKTIAKGQQTDDTSSEVSLRRRSFSGRTSTVGPAVSLNGTAVISPSNFSLLEVDDSCNVYDCLSVLEALVFSAELRLIIKSSMPHPSELIALRLLTEMGMEDIAETRIADLLVWQRRMVSQR